MKKTLARLTAPGFVYFAPLLAFAQFDGGELTSYLSDITGFIEGTIIPFILAIAVLVFIWGVFKFFIMGADDEDARGKGKQLMIWGIIGFVVILTIVGIINLLAGATGLEGEDTLNTPSLPSGS